VGVNNQRHDTKGQGIRGLRIKKEDEEMGEDRI
jgi:hypothetical protein